MLKMSVNWKLLEHMRLQSYLQANFACEYSEDGRIAIVTESGVNILTLKGCMENTFPRFSFRKDLIKLANTTVNEHVGIDLQSFVNELSQEQLYEAVSDDVGVVLQSTTIEAKPSQVKWSPMGIVDGTHCALAVLTNLCCVQIYVKTIDENEIVRFICVANLLQQLSVYYRQSWNELDDSHAKDTKLHELQSRANLLIATAFTWSHIIDDGKNSFCVLLIGHKTGLITAWKFNHRQANDEKTQNLIFMCRYQTQVKQITALHWQRTSKYAGGLSVGDKDGKICAIYVSKLTDTPTFSDELMFCNDLDFKVDKITTINHNANTYLIVVKQNYLFIYAINATGQVLDAKIVDVGNICISGLCHYKENCLFVLGLCGKMKQIELSIDGDKVCCQEELIPLQFDRNKYRTHGFVFSPNRVYIGILLFPCRVKDLGKRKPFVNFLIYANSSRNPFEILMNELVKSIRDYWDCLETLRVLCIQERRFPWIGIDPNLNYDTMSLLQLKILRWISKLSETVYKFVPYIPEYNIKAFVLLNYVVDIKLAIKRMRKLLHIHFSTDTKLSLFQFRSLDLLNFFLKEMVAKDILTKANLGSNFIDEIYYVMQIANELEYPDMPQCCWCGEKIIGTTCLPYHMDSRCAISLMPIDLSPGYKCPFCNCILSKELEVEFYPIFCPYCDVPVEARYFESKITNNTREAGPSLNKITEEPLTSVSPGAITSDCFSDCLQEGVNFSDVESDNGHEYVIFTDSEEEDNELTELYSRFRQIVIGTKTFDRNELVDLDTTKSLSSDEEEQNGEEGEEEDDDEEEEY